MLSGVQDYYYNVKDMGRALAFYRDVLGLTVIEVTDHWTSLDLNGIRLGLHWSGGDDVPRVARAPHGPLAGGCVTFRVRDIRSAVERLDAHGVNILGPVSSQPWGSVVSFEDPDGNVLKLMQPSGKGT